MFSSLKEPTADVEAKTKAISPSKEKEEKDQLPIKAKAKAKTKRREKTEDSSSESEGCDGPVMDDDLDDDLASPMAGLSVSGVDHNSFLPTSDPSCKRNWDDDLILPDTFFSGKKRHHKRNLILEGSCNYFFWMDKIAMVRHDCSLEKNKIKFPEMMNNVDFEQILSKHSL